MLFLAAFLGTALVYGGVRDLLDRPAISTWATIFVSVVTQAMPFLALGVLLSASITAFVPPSVMRRALPDRPGRRGPRRRVGGSGPAGM